MLACCEGEAPTPAPAPTSAPTQPPTEAPTDAPTPSPAPAPTNAPSQCVQFAEELIDTDLSGDLLAANPAASRDGCCGMCEEKEGCDGFSFADADKVCYLKGNFLGTYSAVGVATQLKASLGAGCPGFEAAEQGKDLVGDLIEDWAAPSSEACCESCAKKDFCQGVVFFDNRCYLKSNVQGTFDNAGRVSRVKEGVLSPTQPPTEAPTDAPTSSPAPAPTNAPS